MLQAVAIKSLRANLQSVNPGLTAEWHPDKNLPLTPEEVAPFADKKVWWRCRKGHEWQAKVANRSRGTGCPFCVGRRVNAGNCLARSNPGLAAQWHPTRNGNLTPLDVTGGSNRKAWWTCPKKHIWLAMVSSRSQGRGCPYCSGRFIGPEECLAGTAPKLAREWHPIKNGPLTPREVMPHSARKVWWRCERGHEWQARVSDRSDGNGCPYCHRRIVCADNCLAATNSGLANEWHPTRNSPLTPRDVTAGTGRKVWWTCSQGHEWMAAVKNRNSGSGCPQCAAIARAESRRRAGPGTG